MQTTNANANASTNAEANANAYAQGANTRVEAAHARDGERGGPGATPGEAFGREEHKAGGWTGSVVSGVKSGVRLFGSLMDRGGSKDAKEAHLGDENRYVYDPSGGWVLRGRAAPQQPEQADAADGEDRMISAIQAAQVARTRRRNDHGTLEMSHWRTISRAQRESQAAARRRASREQGRATALLLALCTAGVCTAAATALPVWIFRRDSEAPDFPVPFESAAFVCGSALLCGAALIIAAAAIVGRCAPRAAREPPRWAAQLRPAALLTLEGAAVALLATLATMDAADAKAALGAAALAIVLGEFEAEQALLRPAGGDGMAGAARNGTLALLFASIAGGMAGPLLASDAQNALIGIGAALSALLLVAVIEVVHAVRGD